MALWVLLFLGSAVVRAEDVAITFDDLPLHGELAPDSTPLRIVAEVLAVLKAQGLTDVYGFVNAAKLEGSPLAAEALQLWVAGGQRVGNHTYAHSDLHSETAEQFIEDVRRDEPSLELLAPRGDWQWFRYPYLHEGDSVEKRRAVRAFLARRGYRIAQVTLDFEDHLWNSTYARCVAKGDTPAIARLEGSYLETAAAYLDGGRQMASAVFGREIKHVLLLHLGAFSGKILPALLDLLHRKGFTVVTLAAAQLDPAYDTDPDAASRYGGTFLEQWMDARAIAYPKLPAKPVKELGAICR